MRSFSVGLLKSFDMTEGEVFSGTFSVDTEDDVYSSLYNCGTEESYFAAAVVKAFEAYKEVCQNMSLVTGVATLPQKVISVVISEIV